MASYFHASPMVYYEYRLAALAFDYRALDRYQENFTELQHKNNLIFPSLIQSFTFIPIRLLSLCLLL